MVYIYLYIHAATVSEPPIMVYIYLYIHAATVSEPPIMVYIYLYIHAATATRLTLRGGISAENTVYRLWEGI